MHAAETIGVQPVISAREIADVDVDHLGVMAYAAWFQKHSPGASTSPRPPIVVAPPSPVVKETPPTPIQLQSPRLPPSQAVAVTQVQKETLPNNLVCAVACSLRIEVGTNIAVVTELNKIPELELISGDNY